MQHIFFELIKRSLVGWALRMEGESHSEIVANNWPIINPQEKRMHLTPEELLKLLDEKGYQTSTVRHAALFSVEQSRDLRGTIAGGHTKNLFVKDKKGNFFLLVVEENATIDLNRLHPKIGAKSRLSFGKPEFLMTYLGVTPGSVTAFSVVNDIGNKVKLIIDAPLLIHEKINCHPLTNEMTTTISKDDLLHFLESCKHKAEIVQMSATQIVE